MDEQKKPNKTDDRAMRDFERALDPASLFYDLGMEPDGWQRDLLGDEIDRGIVCCCRQSGKSSGAALLALHCAHYKPGSLTLLVSPSQRQSAELFRKCKEFHRKLPDVVESMTEESVLRAEFSNGSRIVSLACSESTVRGYSGPALVVIDEAARVSDELYAAITPMLATSGGRLLLLSTPFGRRGFYWRAWSEGGERWKRFYLPASECPRISAEFLAEQRQELGEFLYSQEFDLVFLDPLTSAFSSMLIEAALSNEVRPLWKNRGVL
jgi:hypothetical protein